jgi:hypothetical protein
VVCRACHGRRERELVNAAVEAVDKRFNTGAASRLTFGKGFAVESIVSDLPEGVEGAPDVLGNLNRPGLAREFLAIDFLVVNMELLEACPLRGESPAEDLGPADAGLGGDKFGFIGR